jgi:hypothetical protein
MKYTIPYNFILQSLYPVRPKVVKMLGGYALYQEKRMLFFLRERNTELEFNGVFVATQPQFYVELQKEIHHSKMEFDLDGSKDSWIFISEDLDDFEDKVKKACELVKKDDVRIGK